MSDQFIQYLELGVLSLVYLIVGVIVLFIGGFMINSYFWNGLGDIIGVILLLLIWVGGTYATGRRLLD